MEAFLAGEIQREINVVQIDRDVMLPELPRRAGLGWIDRESLAVHVRPACCQKSGTADVNLITDAVHRTVTRSDADRILSGSVVPAKEGEFLARFDIAVGTVFRKVTDLRAGRRRDTSKRQSAHHVLHCSKFGESFESVRSFTNPLQD